MFHDSQISKSYHMADTKVQYIIKFGIAHYLKTKLIYDVRNTPFSFLFCLTKQPTARLRNNIMHIYSIGPKEVIELEVHIVDLYL